jgi:hypothetical protein
VCSSRKYVEQFANGITIICECRGHTAAYLLAVAVLFANPPTLAYARHARHGSPALYLNPVPNTRAPPIEHSIHQVIKEASLLYTLPTNEFFLSRSNDVDSPHAAQEAAYAYVGWIFAQHFCNRLGPAFLALKNGGLPLDGLLGRP